MAISVMTRIAIMTSSALAVKVMTDDTKDNNEDYEPYGESTAAGLLEAHTCIAGSGSTI